MKYFSHAEVPSLVSVVAENKYAVASNVLKVHYDVPSKPRYDIQCVLFLMARRQCTHNSCPCLFYLPLINGILISLHHQDYIKCLSIFGYKLSFHY